MGEWRYNTTYSRRKSVVVFTPQLLYIGQYFTLSIEQGPEEATESPDDLNKTKESLTLFVLSNDSASVFQPVA